MGGEEQRVDPGRERFSSRPGCDRHHDERPARIPDPQDPREVFGLTARARNVFANLTAKGRTVVGGEVRSYSRLLTDSREEAVLRLREAAAEQGANAVLAMRFDANEFGDVISEIVAYGTAATVEEV
jgi:uncharacterized protein YbjQ (UPF0145 family)